MTPPHPDPQGTVIDGPGRRPISDQGRAYCGSAHGQQWTVTDRDPPDWVELPIGSSSVLYRLARQPRSGRPARDQLGNYLYVPMHAHASPAPSEPCEARVIAFPRHGQGRAGPDVDASQIAGPMGEVATDIGAASEHVVIDVQVAVEYGAPIHEVAHRMREHITPDLHDHAGLATAAVAVTVVDVTSSEADRRST